PYLELGDYCVIGRRWDSWDAISAVLTALDERHSHSLQPMLERLWRVTSDFVYGQGGLFNVLTSEEALQEDAAGDREDRRARAGFVAASAARSFLALARTTDIDSALRAPERDPITRTFFRHAQPEAFQPAQANARDGLRQLLEALGDDAPAPLRLAASADEPEAPTLLTRALADLAGRDPARHADRVRELGYLANTLMAGAGTRGERLRPLTAAQGALATCSLGFEHARPETSGANQLDRLGCDVLFRVGWRLLHDQVARPAAAAIERVALRAAGGAGSTQERAALERLAASARSALDENRPAALGPRLELLSSALGRERMAGLAALADDLPALPPSDGGAPRPIATAAQLRQAQGFLETLG
ncbi:MAG TPA: hypothetical protein VHU40_18085, partial [Polyangia bacterium]|nr:hypothetical protein [Polyangia bacterium]